MLSIFIPVFNEERDLEPTILRIKRIASFVGLKDLDFIVVNDGSTDRTAEILDDLAKSHSDIRAIHFDKNQGIGAAFKEALRLAKYDKIGIFPADDTHVDFTIYNLFTGINRADMVLGYVVNPEARGKWRNALSLVYHIIYLLTFNIPIRNINSAPIYPVAALRGISISSRRYGVWAEVNVKLLRRGLTFLEVECEWNPERSKSQAVRLKNLFEVTATYLRLIYEIYFSKRHLFHYSSKRVRCTHEALKQLHVPRTTLNTANRGGL